MKPEVIELVELPTAVCHNCHHQFSARAFLTLPILADDHDGGAGWRVCKCGEKLPAELASRPPMIVAARQLRRLYGDEGAPGFPFWAEISSNGTWKRLDEGRAALGLPAWLTSRRGRMTILAGLLIGWALAELVTRWWP